MAMILSTAGSKTWTVTYETFEGEVATLDRNALTKRLVLRNMLRKKGVKRVLKVEPKVCLSPK